jgi:DNA-binding transcriptional ArsR family regulator
VSRRPGRGQPRSGGCSGNSPIAALNNPAVDECDWLDKGVDRFYISRTIEIKKKVPPMPPKQNAGTINRYASMFSAIGTEPRLRIVRLLLGAHPQGMVVGEIAGDLEISGSTLSHHLEKLKSQDLVKVRREGTFLWYAANTETLQKLLGFLYAECCTRNKAVEPKKIVCCK